MFNKRKATQYADVICWRLHIRQDHLFGHQKYRRIVDARQALAFLCREDLGWSYPQIGEFIGGRAHTTIMTMIKKRSLTKIVAHLIVLAKLCVDIDKAEVETEAGIANIRFLIDDGHENSLLKKIHDILEDEETERLSQIARLYSRPE